MKWIAIDGKGFSSVEKGKAYEKRLLIKLEKEQYKLSQPATNIILKKLGIIDKPYKPRKKAKPRPRKVKPKQRKLLPDKYSEYLYRANKRGFEFDFTREEFEALLKEACHFCGIKPVNSLDRLDSSKGYSWENAVPCCWTCNRMKFTMSPNDFIDHIKQIINHQTSKNGELLH